MTTSCTANGNVWLCVCTNGASDALFEVPEVSGDSACAAAEKACVNPAVLTGDPECTRERVIDPQLCSLEDSCQTWHELDGVRLRTRSVTTAKCEPCSDSAVTCCHCTDKALPLDAPDYSLQDLDLSLGCDFLSELCSGDAPEPAGEPRCEPVLETFSGGDCQLIERCGTPVELADGTALTLSKEFSSSCSGSEDGADCRCSIDQTPRGLQVAFRGVTPSIDLCWTTGRACSEPESVELEGSPVCETITQATTESSCTKTLECTEPATVGDVELEVVTRVSVRCERLDGWSCACGSPSDVPFELEADDAASACAQATELCPRE